MKRGPQAIVVAVLIAIIAFVAPRDDTGVVLRVVSSTCALLLLFAASVALDFYQEAKEKKEQPAKANPFEVVTTKVELPTAPPGGQFEAALRMSEHLQAPATRAPLDCWALLTAGGARRVSLSRSTAR